MTRTPKSPDGENDLPVEALIQAAGRRIDPEASGRAAAKEAVRAAWKTKATADPSAPSRRSARPKLALAAALAGLAIASGLFLWHSLSRPTTTRANVATIEALSGEVFLNGEAIAPAAMATPGGGEVATGDLLETRSEGRMALRLQTGHSVRLDARTRVRWLSTTSLGLERGTIYADSGGRESRSIEIVTPFGSARDIGTQFLAQVRDDEFAILVREGSVELSTPRETRTAIAGESLSATNDGRVEVSVVPSYGESWQWAMEVTPPFDLEGKTVGELLDWVSRETGWTVLFEDPTSAPSARETVIHGAIENLRPDLAAELLLPTAGLVAERRGSHLIVRRAEAF